MTNRLLTREELASELANLVWNNGLDLTQEQRLQVAGAFGAMMGHECVLSAMKKLELYDQAFPF